MTATPLSATDVDKNYRYWRVHLLLSMVIGYAAFYLTRRSVTFAMPVMQMELGLTKGDIGLLGTLFYLAYGGSKFISGIYSDRTGARWFMGVGLLMTGVLNILFAFAVVMQVTRFLQAASVFNGVAAFSALVGYLPLSSASYGIPGLLMLTGAVLIWQVRDSLRPALFAVWLLLVALLNARHGDVMMLSGVLLTLTVLFCVYGLVPAPGRRLQAGRWFAPAYALHLLCIGFLVSVL